MAVVYDHDYCLHAKCAENADCTEIQFGHNCDCHRGFKGDGVNFCVDIDECSLANRPGHNRKGPFQNCKVECVFPMVIWSEFRLGNVGTMTIEKTRSTL